MVGRRGPVGVTALLALASAACSPRLAPPAPAPALIARAPVDEPRSAVERRSAIADGIRSEATVVCDLVVRRSLEDNGDVMVVFSTKAVPAWAKDKAAIEAVYGGPTALSKVVLDSYEQPWNHRVPAGIVGKRWDAIADDQIILEVVDLPSYVPCLGVTKEGLIKTGPDAATPPKP